ncbi:helix-turn-helix domain-containing protein [Asanoa sp. NPDC049573]|uniref:helix-turn-helix domain-containing protein n=1 Tax=Asanoa sp. NPDC049573 TaxID=3155396 RepID=UPI00343F6E3C
MARSSALSAATRVEPDPDDQERAAAVSRVVADADRLTILLPDGREIELPAALVSVLRATADELSAGHAVTVLASEVLLSPAEVGELLGLSRPFIVRLLDEGQLPAEYLPDSRHRVVRLAAVLEFQARRERRRTGRRRIAEIAENEDLPY